jgi:hypothetical protein
MIRRFILPMLLLALPAIAEPPVGAAAIHAALVGNTVTGNMLASGGYAEFYAADGSIRAADYTGKWAIKGDRMCFDYGDAAETCFAVALAGAHVVWLGEGGEEGAGVIQSGNPGGW